MLPTIAFSSHCTMIKDPLTYLAQHYQTFSVVDHDTTPSLLIVDTDTDIHNITTPMLILGKDIPLPITILQLYHAIERHLSSHIMIFGTLQYNTMTRSVTLSNGEIVYLREKEGELLETLMQQQGEPIAEEVLLASIWGYHADIDSHTLKTHIYRLRQKIDPEGVMIITDANGYYLTS